MSRLLMRDHTLTEFCISKGLKSWIDIGARGGATSKTLERALQGGPYEMFDPKPTTRHVKQLTSSSLESFEKDSFDFVLFNWVLRNSSLSIEQLLREAGRVARKYVFVQEDLDDGSEEVRNLFRTKDPQGKYFSQDQWQSFFKAMGAQIEEEVLLPGKAVNDPPNYDVPRMLFVLDVTDLQPSDTLRPPSAGAQRIRNRRVQFPPPPAKPAVDEITALENEVSQLEAEVGADEAERRKAAMENDGDIRREFAREAAAEAAAEASAEAAAQTEPPPPAFSDS